MITYLLQLTLCWSIFFAAYYLFLRQETHFRYNRWYLLTALTLGLVIPLVNWGNLLPHQPESLGHLYIAPFNSQMAQWDVTVKAEPQLISWYQVVVVVYCIGILLTASQLIRGWLKILEIRRRSELVDREEYTLVLTNEPHMPFSFWGSVYCSREFYEESTDIDQILAHEECHIMASHSLDIVLLELLKVVFWFHPLVYLYKNELQQIHEYQADYAACHLSTKRAYGELLLNHAESVTSMTLANHFFNSQLKNRFKMMTKKPSTRKALFKYLIAVPFIGLAVLLFSFSKGDFVDFDNIMPSVSLDTLLPPPPPSLPHIGETIMLGQDKYVVSKSDLLYVNGRRIGYLNDDLIDQYSGSGSWILEVYRKEAAKEKFDPKIETNVYSLRKEVPTLSEINKELNPESKKSGEIFRVVEQMPHFPGCDDIEDQGQRKSCADRKMLEFLYTNIKYPAQARNNGVEGNVVVSFVVEKDGTITNPKVIRDPGAGLGEEAVRIVKMMSVLPEKWSPGVQKGRNVRVQFILPVKFELASNDQEVKGPPPPPSQNVVKGQEEVFRVVEEMPRFPGCEEVDGNNQEKKLCADRKMLEFIYNNVRYPAAARNNGVQGNVVVTFTIEKDGSITSPKIIRDPGAGLGEEAIRVVNMMSDLPEKWTPGVQRGHDVRVQFVLPIKFELGTSDENQVDRPLLVIDDEIIGRVDMDNVNETIEPSDIQSINVLKDQKAIEKYGDKGGDGVIEITTKWRKGIASAQLKVANVKIYPVPAENRLNIEGNVEESGDYKLEVRDLKGSVVREQQINVQSGPLRAHFDLNGLAAGPYYIMVRHQGKIFLKVFVKQ